MKLREVFWVEVNMSSSLEARLQRMKKVSDDGKHQFLMLFRFSELLLARRLLVEKKRM